MLFHEIYGAYYNAVAAILSKAVEGNLTDKQLSSYVKHNAFAESALTIPAALKSGAWPLLTETMSTPLKHKPSMPLTTLQKRWLKALLLDPRVQLFCPDESGLEDVKPLFRPEHIVYFDRYADGDPYNDPNYRSNFRTILTALQQEMRVTVDFRGAKGRCHRQICSPIRMEYSPRDDKFRVIVKQRSRRTVINISRIEACQLEGPVDTKPAKKYNRSLQPLVMEIEDRRNALNRVMLHFSHLEKETVRMDERHYRLTVWYDKDDEAEILIRVISFGPMLRVLEPSHLVERIRMRLARQNAMQTQNNEENSTEC